MNLYKKALDFIAWFDTTFVVPLLWHFIINYYKNGTSYINFYSWMARTLQFNYKCMSLFYLISLFFANLKNVTNFKIFRSEWSVTHICKFTSMEQVSVAFHPIYVPSKWCAISHICHKSGTTLKPLCGEHNIFIT